jgi:hypothetical protein
VRDPPQFLANEKASRSQDRCYDDRSHPGAGEIGPGSGNSRRMTWHDPLRRPIVRTMTGQENFRRLPSDKLLASG